LLRGAGVNRRVRRSLSFVVAVSGCLSFYACGSSSSNNTQSLNDGGPEANANETGGSDTGMDTGMETGNTPMDTGTETGDDSSQPETSVSDAGYGGLNQPCIQPLSTCNLGLYCNTGVCVASSCQGKTYRPLPYNIASDFNTVFTIGPEMDNFQVIPNAPDCNATSFPSIPNTGLGDGGTPNDAGLYPPLDDGAVQIVTYPAPPSSCYEFLFDPSCQAGGQGLCWAGAIFTNSPATAAAATGGTVTGSAVGTCIAPGATEITFWAKASMPGTIVKFGSSRPGACQLVPVNPDGGTTDPVSQQNLCPNDVEYYIGLSTQWQMYSVSLANTEPYNDEPNGGGGVWNAFSVVVEPQFFIGGAYIFLKDIVWTNPATGGYDAGPVITPTPEAGPADSGAGG
jgi:hypothetical protein